ncbi:MAG: hypothetical protein EB075_07485 [Bacteroidetes bacterium]|nr:hypothetical protein [Bacteroidota bacterium]
MKFKTHSSVGDLMFREFSSLDDLLSTLKGYQDDLPFTELVVLRENPDTRSGWSALAVSRHVVDPFDGDSWTSNDVSALSGALDDGARVRWVLFCDDDPLDQCINMVITLR